MRTLGSAVVLAAAVSLIAASPAFSATGVFGGSTSAGEAIVLTTDAKAKKLRSVVIAWEAPCQDGRIFPMAIKLTPVADEPGFSSGPEDLVVSRNAKGRFAGTQFAAMALSAQTAAISVELSGKLRGGRASGRLAATVSILDDATGTEVGTCETGSLRWSASRSAGRIYGGQTSQGEPVVVRLDRKRKKVNDLLAGWETSSCEPPDRYFRVGDRFINFAVRARRFGGTFDSSYPTDDGGRIVLGFDVAGTLSSRTMRGTLRVTVTGTDAAGATNLTCDSGAIDWRAATG
jgi:hypothetical protein